MFGAGVISPLGALVALVFLVIWIVVLVWVAARIQGFLSLKTGWPAFDWRTMLGSFLLLIAAVHLGNFLLDVIDRWWNDASYPLNLEFPGAFLIGSVAIGVGVAAVQSRRRK